MGRTKSSNKKLTPPKRKPQRKSKRRSAAKRKSQLSSKISKESQYKNTKIFNKSIKHTSTIDTLLSATFTNLTNHKQINENSSTLCLNKSNKRITRSATFKDQENENMDNVKPIYPNNSKLISKKSTNVLCSSTNENMQSSVNMDATCILINDSLKDVNSVINIDLTTEDDSYSEQLNVQNCKSEQNNFSPVISQNNSTIISDIKPKEDDVIFIEDSKVTDQSCIIIDDDNDNNTAKTSTVTRNSKIRSKYGIRKRYSKTLSKNRKATEKLVEALTEVVRSQQFVYRRAPRCNNLATTIQNTINERSKNIINPSASLREIIIDGSNVAMGHSNGKIFSVEGLQIAINYFLQRGHKVTAFVPQYRLLEGQSSNQNLLNALVSNRSVIITPSRLVNGRRITPYDDRYILEYATSCQGIVVSGDNYRDIIHEDAGWRNTVEKRLLMPTWVDDTLMFPKDPLGRYGPNLETFLRFP